jgi:hypothetical protein
LNWTVRDSNSSFSFQQKKKKSLTQFFYSIERPMRIAYATGPAAPVTAAAPVRSQPRSTRGGGNSRGRGGRGGRGGRRSEGQPKKSQEELDAEMDNYMQAPPVRIFFY